MVVAVVAELVVVAVVDGYTCPVPLVTVSLEGMLYSSLLLFQIICRFFPPTFCAKNNLFSFSSNNFYALS